MAVTVRGLNNKMVPLYLTAVVSALVIIAVRVSGASWGNSDENSLSEGLTALLELAMRQDLPETAVHKENPLQSQQRTMRHKQAMAVAVEMLLKQLLREEQIRRQKIEEQQETVPGPTSKPSYGAPKPSYGAPKPSYGHPNHRTGHLNLHTGHLNLRTGHLNLHTGHLNLHTGHPNHLMHTNYRYLLP